ncbi:hypothetical protein DICPUDRAFT_29825 [Dictyostelium purpureum]|uniref:O-methyltransferase C-terminal domain-containing protein n=1 Tax=Dictyostelium purpureum TaxID=5786 RepID=F0ZEA1_DICPU|nr:uncharacterized protein DICPUDRAFT_29825 [Dictyostelium purpureum]EGC37718.1 hypothetical protein DICPUDRAFT_29825 [Dictyostelium purpureum]|eukprot:XP_003285739.1 hypothetical protein DICPUDRAFT_29825 [Dictyostelium purpureum]
MQVNETSIEINKSIEVMTNFVTGHLQSRMFYFIMKHGFCDILEDGAKHYTEVAKAVNINENVCYRVLRYFSATPNNLWVEDKENIGTFRKTTSSSMFTKSGKLKSIGELQTHDVMYKLIECLPDTLESGKSNAPQTVFNVDTFWDIFKENKEYKNLFTHAMRDCTDLELKSVLNRFDFSKFKTIVDIGGSHGLLINSIVEKNSKVKGINFDMGVILDTPSEQRSHNQNVEYVSGNFFESVPEADAYILKHILHNWSDEDCSRILKTISKNIRKGGQVFVFETVINPKSCTRFEVFMDLLMMQTLNSKERTLNEWKHLFDSAGFRVESVHDDTRPHCLVLTKKE